MLSDFTYTLVSGRMDGGDFSNTCNELLDFQTRKYEVCMQDLMLTVGSWDNVREGGNMISVKTSQATLTAYLKYGRYTNLYTFMYAIDTALKRVGYGDRFELTGKVEAFKGSHIENGKEVPVWAGDTYVAPRPEEPPYLKMKQDTDIAITFCKELAYLLAVIPTITYLQSRVVGRLNNPRLILLATT